ncbi:galactose mutarotase [Listeria sp. FSL L7-1485]|uniref:Aldose 1-epimerase n=1 Tax=Listeria immobilis TaxID=2713502 RepID=A0A7X0X960_9LIST|nr:aldose epimerase family protein [Listeria immobilis]MBC1489924.1 galactose mutarotase [Listeria immobilis]MBC1536919.1 galactose mutarotase [Listeria immobilis]
MDILKKSFGKTADLFILKNNQGSELAVSNQGARIVSLKVMVDGKLRETVLGFDSIEEYLEKDPYIGASIGRFSGRIRQGTFTIEQQQYQVSVDSETGHNLHGGIGFDKYMWEATEKIAKDFVAVTFTFTSPDGDQGFPGNLTAKVTYTLTNTNEWKILYTATTDKATIYNPTNHVYFNLTGDSTKGIDEHILKMNAERYIEVDKQVIPTGNVNSVQGTIFDFTQGKKMSELFTNVASEASKIDGLDHPFLLNKQSPQVTLTSPDKKVIVEMTTDDPAVVVFTANVGDEGPIMHGKKLANHGGITLETQVAPGATDYPEWGNVILKPNERFEKETVYKLIIQES